MSAELYAETDYLSSTGMLYIAFVNMNFMSSRRVSDPYLEAEHLANKHHKIDSSQGCNCLKRGGGMSPPPFLSFPPPSPIYANLICIARHFKVTGRKLSTRLHC